MVVQSIWQIGFTLLDSVLVVRSLDMLENLFVTMECFLDVSLVRVENIPSRAFLLLDFISFKFDDQKAQLNHTAIEKVKTFHFCCFSIEPIFQLRYAFYPLTFVLKASFIYFQLRLRSS